MGPQNPTWKPPEPQVGWINADGLGEGGYYQLKRPECVEKDADGRYWLARRHVFDLGIHHELHSGDVVQTGAGLQSRMFEVVGWRQSTRSYWLREFTWPSDQPVMTHNPGAGG